MEYMVLGLVVAINFIIVKMKLDRKRWEDAICDVTIMVVILTMFSGSYAGLIVGSVASLCISIYFFASPPRFFSGKEGVLHTIIRKSKRTNK